MPVEQPVDEFAEKRYAPRKAVALTLRAWIEGVEGQLTVRDLSHTGFLVEAGSPLTLDQTIELELPNVGRKEAKVVWAGDTLAGCTFSEPLSKASVSAALLKSEVLAPQAIMFEPVAYEAEDDYEDNKLPVPARLAIIGVGSVMAWTPLVLIGAVLVG